MTGQVRGAVCVGEVLIELARGADGRFSLSCGGDTFNTAVYLARAGIETAFASALGTVAEVATAPVLSRLYGTEIEVVRAEGHIFVLSRGRDVERADHGHDHDHNHAHGHHHHA